MLSKALLSNTSEYFAKALSNGFKETEKRELALPESTLQSVQLFIYWLCKQEVPSAAKDIETLPQDSQDRKDFVTKQQETLVRLWCFAERFMIHKLQNAAIKRMLELLRTNYIRAEILDLAFRLTSTGSMLRVVTLRSFMHHRTPELSPKAFAGLKYEKSDIDHLEETPGLMPQLLELMAKARCKRFPCICTLRTPSVATCYVMNGGEDHLYMMPE